MRPEPAGPSERGFGGRITRAREVLQASLHLGLTSFGGPIAHLGYFERSYVQQRKWLSEQEYASLVALCQILPGPASSQVGFLVGLHRAGWLGAVAAWVGFTLPSALLLYAGAALSARAHGPLALAALHGLKLVAVAVVAQAVWSMGRRLCPDRTTMALALLAGSLLLIVGGAFTQLAALVIGAVGGILFCRQPMAESTVMFVPVRREFAWTAVVLFVLLLLGLPFLAARSPHGIAALADTFYRAGALVFGGGHVVLPLLRDALVPAGWLTDDVFLTGYGLAQAVPGPLFTVAAYLGAANDYTTSPAVGATTAVVFIFLPGLLIAVAGVSLWNRLSRYANVRAGLVGINAAVVGLLGAALYDPVWTTAVHTKADVAIAIAGLMLLERWRVAPIVVVAFCVVTSCAGLLRW
jgi:chromate transporter